MTTAAAGLNGLLLASTWNCRHDPRIMQGRVSSCCFVILAFGLAAFGCGGATSSEGPGSTAIGRTNFISQLATAFCEGIANCCTQYAIPHDTAACKVVLQAQLNNEWAEELANPAIGFDLNAAGRCIDAYRNAVTACTDQTLASKANEPCQLMLVGTVAIGEVCTVKEECIDNPGQDVGCESGHCTNYASLIPTYQIPRAGLGELCSTSCDLPDNGSMACSGGAAGTSTEPAACYASDGLVCTEGICTAIPTVGQSCASSYVCASGAYCDSQTCMSKKANGSACLSSGECVGGQCGSDGLCRTWSMATTATCGGVLDG